MSRIHSPAAAKIGKQIRAVRLELGISQEDLGELSEINWTTIGKIERGVSSPTVETLVRLATALSVEPGSLITGVTPDDYGSRSHRLTARDLIQARAHEQTEP
ncbi:helix-turn-helix domain-containing protein [Leucobacter chromiireducens]|uniref:helix-turn-helix domain-containing protein n=1 Tax=Leucobacter chromiireducens TaxID=283877 RepID=UPI003F8036DE